jgi:Hint domain
MTTFTWVGFKGSLSGDWVFGANWSPAFLGPPGAADTAVIGQGTTAYTVTYNTSSTITALTINNANATLQWDTSTAEVMTVSGATTISAGTLDLAATTKPGSSLSTNSLAVSGGAFKSGNSVTVTGPANFTGGTDTISGGVFNAGTLTIGGTSTVLMLAGGTLRTSVNNSTANVVGSGDEISINAGSTLDFTNAGAATGGGFTNSGTVIGAGTLRGIIAGAGTIEANGGTLDLTSNVGASTGASFDIFGSASSVLQVDGTIGSGNTFTFLPGAAGGLRYTNTTAGLTSAIRGLNVGTSAATPTNFIDFSGRAVTIQGSNKFSGTGPATVTLSDGVGRTSTLTLNNLTGSASGTWFVNAISDNGTGTEIFLSTVVCFAAGTRILTATGERVVESLLQGDIALTLAEGELRARPVKWVGRRRIDLTAHQRPETVAPIRIRRGAFADAMPHADLLVSPDHAIFVDGKLICARQLVNGTTILQQQGWTSVDYYHVELDAHAILLAEGLPAESYLDTGNRGFFGNSNAPLILHPDLTGESDYPAREAGSCSPFVSNQAEVRPVWQRLADRAAALGQPVPQLETTTDPAPRLIARGRTVKPTYDKNGLYLFALPQGATEVRLVSRSAAPTDVRPWLEDRRRLGLYVERIVLRGEDDVREVPIDHPGLSRGWWAVERLGTALRRWTDGDAVVLLPEIDRPTMLEIRAGSAALSYPVQGAREVRAA